MRTLVIKLLCLGSFIGGPLYCCDVVKATWPEQGDVGFGVLFAPLAVMLLAVFSFGPEEPWLVRRIFGWAGLVAAVLFLLEDGFTAVAFARGATHPNHDMIVFGLLIGALTIGLFVPAALAAARAARGKASTNP